MSAAAGRLRSTLPLLGGAVLLGAGVLVARFQNEAPPSQISIEEAHARVYPNGAGAIYLRVVNAGGGGDVLEGASAPWARRIELHEVVRSGDIVGMRDLSAGLPVAPHAAVELRSGGRHLMLRDAQIAAGEREAPLSLRFARAGTLAISVRVDAAGLEREMP